MGVSSLGQGLAVYPLLCGDAKNLFLKMSYSKQARVSLPDGGKTVRYGTVREAMRISRKLPALDWSGIIRKEIREKAVAPLDAIIVHAVWDQEASAWVATSDDIDGLAVEAATIEALEPKVKAALSDLIELNGPSSTLRQIPVRILAEQTSLIANPHAA